MSRHTHVARQPTQMFPWRAEAVTAVADQLHALQEASFLWHGMAGLSALSRHRSLSPSISKMACFSCSTMLSRLMLTVIVLPVSVLTNTCRASGPAQASHRSQVNQWAWYVCGGTVIAATSNHLRLGHGTHAHAHERSPWGPPRSRSGASS